MWIIIIGSIILFAFLWFSNNRIILPIKLQILTAILKLEQRSFIHKIAIKNYRRGIKHLIDIYSKIDKEELADYLVMSVWTRSRAQIEGYFRFPDGQKNLLPDLYYYMWTDFERIVSEFKRRHLYREAIAMSIWVHTVRGLLYEPEIGGEFNRLWQLLMTTNNLWDKHVNKFYNEDKGKLSPQMLSDIMTLSKEILRNLPPKRSYESQSMKNASYENVNQEIESTIAGVQSKIESDKEHKVESEKICPSCGKNNPPDAFRCRNEDCLDILPQQGQSLAQDKNSGIDEVVLRTAYAFNKSISLGQEIMAKTFQTLRKLKNKSKNDELDFTSEQGKLFSKEIAKISFFWLTRDIYNYFVKDEQKALSINLLLDSWFKKKYGIECNEIEEYARVEGTLEEEQVFGKNVGKIFNCCGMKEVQELNLIPIGFYEEHIKNIKDAFAFPLSEIKKYIS
jgi:ribosomal protein L40E